MNFMEETPKVERHSVRGALSEYANPERMKEESSAWEKAVVKKYGDARYEYDFTLSAE